MTPLNYPPVAQNLVNYTVIPTQASNEIFVAETNAPDSLAFLIRNSVMVKISPVLNTQSSPDQELKNY
jgi:hypothetical protein